MRIERSARRRHGTRPGSAYVAVLGAATVLAVMGLGAMAAMRAQRASILLQHQTREARFLAESGVQLAMQWIAADANWRVNRPNGVWASDVPLGRGRLTIAVTDPVDGNLANRPTDPLIIQATAQVGQATQIVEVRAEASGPPLDCLRTAMHTAGQIHVRSDRVLAASGAPVSTNGELRNNGTIVGHAECLAYTGSGSVTGTLSVGATPKPMPDPGVFAMYAALGTPISPGSTVDRRALGPGFNPYGAANPDGVYVISSSANVTIRNTRILGTLVIICPGKTVTVEDSVHFENYRSDYPVLLVDGNLVLNFSAASALSESSRNVNYNPPGVPYAGETDADLSDTYPSEIRGLVHARGPIVISNAVRVIGAIIGQSSASSNAVDITDRAEISWTRSLLMTPPMGYMKSVQMTVAPGSWRAVVLP